MNSLLNFELENFKSFKEVTKISFIPSRGKEFEEKNIFENHEKRFLKILAIHGLNSTGKSNLILAISLLKDILLNGIIYGKESISKIEGYRFVENWENKITKFKIEFMIDNIIYIYGLEIKKGIIIKEFLNKKIRKEIMIFMKKSWTDIKYSDSYLDEKIIKIIPDFFKKENISLLSILINAGESEDTFCKIKNFFENIEISSEMKSMNSVFSPQETYNYLDSCIENKEKFFNFMKKYEKGIEKFLYQKEEEEINLDELKKKLPPDIFEELKKDILEKVEEESKELKLTSAQVKMNVIHKIYNENKKPIEEVILDFDKYTSIGTKKLYSLGGYFLKSFENGGVVVIDELDSLIHTLFVVDILKKYQNKEINLKNAQLIYTGHNPYILDAAQLRRDQILMIRKNIYGESRIEKLSDNKEIKTNNSFFKNYLKILEEDI